MAIPPLDDKANSPKSITDKASPKSITDKANNPKSITDKASNPKSITDKTNSPKSITDKASNPRPHKPSNTQQKIQKKQGDNSNIKNTNKNKPTPVSGSPFFDERVYNVMTRWEQQDYLDKLDAMPKYETRKMTELEALVAIEEIKSNVSSIMRLCYELATRKGYEALGYKDFKECVIKELSISYAYAHKMKNAGEVHVVVCPQLPMGTVSESVLRPMHGLSHEEMQKVWNSSVEEFSDGAPIIPTARDINCTIRAMELVEDTIDVKGLERQLRYIEFSPELVEKVQENILALIKEYIEKSSPVSKEHFEKVVRILLNELRTTILDKYEKLYGKKK